MKYQLIPINITFTQWKIDSLRQTGLLSYGPTSNTNIFRWGSSYRIIGFPDLGFNSFTTTNREYIEAVYNDKVYVLGVVHIIDLFSDIPKLNYVLLESLIRV